MTRNRGFTLLEVVVAFALLGLVLATAFEVFSAGLARAAELGNRAAALAIAQSQLAAAGVEETLKEGETRGESQDRRFQWVVRIAKTDPGIDPSKPAPSIYSLYRIDVVVGWRSADGRDRSESLSTLAIWPTSPT